MDLCKEIHYVLRMTNVDLNVHGFDYRYTVNGISQRKDKNLFKKFLFE